jgi:hypothetical protein
MLVCLRGFSGSARGGEKLKIQSQFACGYPAEPMRAVVRDLILAKDIQHANLYRRRGRSGELILIRDIRTGAEPR